MNNLHTLLFPEIVRMVAASELPMVQRKVAKMGAEKAALAYISTGARIWKKGNQHRLYFDFNAFYFDMNSKSFEYQDELSEQKQYEACVAKLERSAQKYKVAISDEVVAQCKAGKPAAPEPLTLEPSDDLKVSMTHAAQVVFEVNDNYPGTAFRCTKALQHWLSEKRKQPELHDYHIDQLLPVFAEVNGEVICMTQEEFKSNDLQEAALQRGERYHNDVYFWTVAGR